MSRLTDGLGLSADFEAILGPREDGQPSQSGVEDQRRARLLAEVEVRGQAAQLAGRLAYVGTRVRATVVCRVEPLAEQEVVPR